MSWFVTIGFFGTGQHGKSFSSGSHACCEQSHALGHSVWNPGQCLDLELWMPVDKTINMLADAATPAALFTIGAMLARSKMNSTSRMPASYYLPGVMIKLFIHPLFT